MQVNALTRLSIDSEIVPEHQVVLQTGGDSLPKPVKRPVAGQSNPLKRQIDQGAYQTPPRPRRAKALPGESFIMKHPDLDRKATLSLDLECVDKRPRSQKRLFDPVQDKATSVSTPGKKDKGDRPLAFCRVYEPQSGLSQSKAKVQVDQAPYGNHLVTRPGSDTKLDPESKLPLQPKTRPISHDQLVAEVKGIYAGLVMVEAKCIDVDDKQTVAALDEEARFRQPKRTPEQWQALISLHKTLLHEHHDFFLASQHPSASPALSRLAAKYSMPAKMWRHEIHAFLEVLRHRLPHSLDHMLAFIYTAYSMMALLYETVSAFKDTWIECLGDLGRYRMAIEDDDIKDREIWNGVARFGCEKAADKSSNTGRLYHHLAILARPYNLQQLSLYTRSSTCIIPFESSKASIMMQFSPILDGTHALLFTGGSTPVYNECIQRLCSGVSNSYIGRVTVEFKEQGVFAALSSISSLFEYGALTIDGSLRSTLRNIDAAMQIFEQHIPWAEIANFLNSRIKLSDEPNMFSSRIITKLFPRPNEGVERPLPEDFVMRGQLRTDLSFPSTWFSDSESDGEEQFLLLASGTVPCNRFFRSNWGKSTSPRDCTRSRISKSFASKRRSYYQKSTCTAQSRKKRNYGLPVQRVRSSWLCSLALMAILITPILASEQSWEHSHLTASKSSLNDRSVDLNVPPFPNWTFPIFCVTFVAICWKVAIHNQWERIQVSGTFTAVAWWLWLYLKQDPNTSPMVSWPYVYYIRLLHALISFIIDYGVLALGPWVFTAGVGQRIKSRSTGKESVDAFRYNSNTIFQLCFFQPRYGDSGCVFSNKLCSRSAYRHFECSATLLRH